MTSSKDWNVVIWDLASETDPPRRVVTIRFDAPIASASFHPRNRSVEYNRMRVTHNLVLTFWITSQILLVLLSVGEAYIVDLRKAHRGRMELCEPDDGEEDTRQRCVWLAFPLPPPNLVSWCQKCRNYCRSIRPLWKTCFLRYICRLCCSIQLEDENSAYSIPFHPFKTQL